MFDAVRNNKRIVQGFLILITLPFAFWGVDSYIRGGQGGATIATVGDVTIGQAQFQQSLLEQAKQLQQRLGPQFDPKMLAQPALRQQLLNQLIDQNLLIQEAGKRHIYASDAALQQLIVSIPAFQDNGRFNKARYESALMAQGLNPQGFEAQLRRDITLQQLVGTLGDTSFVPKTLAELVFNTQTENREIQEISFSADQFLPKVALSTNAVQDYYSANQKAFELPEQAKVEYVVLSSNALRGQVNVSEAEIRSAYENNTARYQESEERRASHILITLDEKASEADKAKTKEKAESVLKEVKANPAKFEIIARQQSQDPGSAKQGGDLGFFGKGNMVRPFEDAVWSLKEGEISGLVKSDFGFHIIRLTAVKGGKVKPFSSVRTELEAELLKQAITRKFAESAELFKNMVYEQADSLQPVAEKFHLPIQQAGWTTKQAALTASPVSHPKLVEELFSDDTLKNHRNTQSVEVGKDTLVSARVTEYKQATTQPLESVRVQIEQVLKKQAALDSAKSASDAALVALNAGKSIKENWSAARDVSRMNAKSVPAQALGPIFKMTNNVLPAYTQVEVPGKGFVVYKLLKVKADPMNEAQRANAQKAISQQLTSLLAQEELETYLKSLRQRYKVTIDQTALMETSTER